MFNYVHPIVCTRTMSQLDEALALQLVGGLEQVLGFATTMIFQSPFCITKRLCQ